MDVHILSALADNYMYVIVDKESSEAAVVDPVDSAKVLDFISQSTPSLNLTTILTTHHHWDHSGGNRKMLAAKPNLEVLGGEKRVEGVSRIVAHGDRLCLGQLQIECLFTPCHTKGHICYKVSTGDDIALFTGDTLFLAGCGKFFEGTAQQMYEAMSMIGKLPNHTKIYCGHEYTLSNLHFAQFVESNNENIKRKIQFAKECQTNQMPTVPSTLEEEKLYNPFMRTNESAVQERVNHPNDPVQTMAELRRMKNNFKAPQS